jgi:hypothetical protein
MPTTLYDLGGATRKPIYKAIAFVNSSTIKTDQISPQRFWLADTVISVSLNVLQDLIDPLQRFSVLYLPVKIVFPCGFGKE